MSCLFLTEQDVAELIDMPRSIEIVEEACRRMAAGRVHNVPRTRAMGPGISASLFVNRVRDFCHRSGLRSAR